MTNDPHLLLYASPNGDRWSLCRGGHAADVHVLHEPNGPSGGRPTRIDLGRFLAGGAAGPEHRELLRRIGSLIPGAAAAPVGGPAPEPGASAAEPTPGEALR